MARKPAVPEKSIWAPMHGRQRERQTRPSRSTANRSHRTAGLDRALGERAARREPRADAHPFRPANIDRLHGAAVSDTIGKSSNE